MKGACACSPAANYSIFGMHASIYEVCMRVLTGCKLMYDEQARKAARSLIQGGTSGVVSAHVHDGAQEGCYCGGSRAALLNIDHNLLME
jgi:hypothetical protein